MKQVNKAPILLLGLVLLVTATFAGFVRIGWRIPAIPASIILEHGPLMVTGFLGTLITLERAVAIGKRLALLGALGFALGGLLIALDISETGGKSLTVAGSLGLLVIFIYFLQRDRSIHTWVLAAGALFLLLGSIIWLVGRPVLLAVPWWIAFLVLTIAGERLELGKIISLSAQHRNYFLVSAAIFSTGVGLSYRLFDAGLRVMGVGLIALAIWHLRFDIARKTIKNPGLTRYIAICMLAGFAWLFVGGLLYLIFGLELGGVLYDAQLHAIFLGFVFSMIFGHAPIIFPAILGRPIHFQKMFYAHLGLLHISLIVRLMGDLLLLPDLRRWGGMFNGIAIFLFLFSTAYAVFFVRKN